MRESFDERKMTKEVEPAADLYSINLCLASNEASKAMMYSRQSELHFSSQMDSCTRQFSPLLHLNSSSKSSLDDEEMYIPNAKRVCMGFSYDNSSVVVHELEKRIDFDKRLPRKPKLLKNDIRRSLEQQL